MEILLIIIINKMLYSHHFLFSLENGIRNFYTNQEEL
jgi:hypothetical protein